jgi:hypothetical protein
VLVEAQLAAGPDHPEQVAQHRALLRDRAQDERRYGCVEGSVLEWEHTAQAVHDRHGHRSCSSRLLGPLAQVRLRLDRHQLGHAEGVVPEVDPVPGPELDDASGQSHEHRLAMLSLAHPLLALAQAVEDAGEDRVANGAHGWIQGAFRRGTGFAA